MSYKLICLHLSTLDRMLDAILQDEEQGIELYTPNPDDYMYVCLSCIYVSVNFSNKEFRISLEKFKGYHIHFFGF